jgi:hypothetical protein
MFSGRILQRSREGFELSKTDRIQSGTIRRNAFGQDTILP